VQPSITDEVHHHPEITSGLAGVEARAVGRDFILIHDVLGARVNRSRDGEMRRGQSFQSGSGVGTGRVDVIFPENPQKLPVERTLP